MICPVCDATGFIRFSAGGRPVRRCPGCGCGALDEAPAHVSAAMDPDSFSRQTPQFLDLLRRRGMRPGPLLMASHTAVLDQAAPASYAAAVILHQLENEAAPGQLLRKVHAALRPGAPLLVKLSQGYWSFDPSAIQLLLLRYGFHEILARKQRAAGLLVTATRCEPPGRPKCSIIVAAFNECLTFSALMNALVNKTIPGVEREIILVESNSTDGTRELAKLYQDHPEVKLVLQDRPRGKGHAIRHGFQYATGDIILIQDADLEYDLDDYDALLAPLLARRALFVLGTRHSGDWKMRRFAQQKILATGLNLAHAFFTRLINLLYHQRMTDPFTMFKVFHRDCLFGLEFKANRFDFDHELVIKLVRKGYRPLEIPVNYSSRSFREGKKVRLFRDPFAWLWIDLKLRFARVLPKHL